MRCSVGCQCINCSNIEEVTKQRQIEEIAEIALEEETYTTDTEADMEDIMEKAFGSEEGMEAEQIDESDSDLALSTRLISKSDFLRSIYKINLIFCVNT